MDAGANPNWLQLGARVDLEEVRLLWGLQREIDEYIYTFGQNRGSSWPNRHVFWLWNKNMQTLRRKTPG